MYVKILQTIAVILILFGTGLVFKKSVFSGFTNLVPSIDNDNYEKEAIKNKKIAMLGFYLIILGSIIQIIIILVDK